MIPNNVNNLVIIVDILGGHYIMKFFKFFTSFIGIFIIVLFIFYADIDNDWVESFVNTFEQTNAEFKFYDIKANCLIEGELCENEMKNICIDIVKALNLDPKDINWNIKDNKKELKIYAVTDIRLFCLTLSISFAFILYNIFCKISLHLSNCNFFAYCPAIQVNTCILLEYTLSTLYNFL